MQISQVLAAKANQGVVTVRPDATVRELVEILAEHNVGALIVSSNGHHVEGIVSERDVVRRLNEDESLLDLPVSAIMTADVASCRPEDSVNGVRQLMTARRIRHVPVLQDETLTGIISIGDVVKSRMSELEFERDQLDSYVQRSQT